MKDEPLTPSPLSLTLNLMSVLLSVSILVLLTLDQFVAFRPEEQRLIDWMDAGACAVFATEFMVRRYTASDRLAYMRWGWIDLLVGVPGRDFLRYGRGLRVLRSLWVLKGFYRANHLRALLRASRTGVTSSMLTVGAVFLVATGALIILVLERADPAANIQTAGDALWWSLCTLATVGYGDVYPVTVGGKIFTGAFVLMGVTYFGTFTASLVTALLGQPREDLPLDELSAELRLLREALEHRRGLASSDGTDPGDARLPKAEVLLPGGSDSEV